MKGFWAQRNPRERVLILLCLVAVAICVPLILIPAGRQGKRLLPAAEARRKYEALLKQKKALEEESDRLKPEIEKMAFKEPPETLVPQAIRTLQQYAKESGIHLREIKPLRARRTASLTKVPLSVRFTAAFSQSVPFLYRVEDPKGKFVVEKFNVTADPKSNTVDVEAQLALFTKGSEGEGSRG